MTEVTKVEPKRLPVAVGVPLNGLDEAFRLAQNLALAQSLPDSLRGKASDVLAIVLYGQELGLAPMQSIQGIYVVKGKPQLASQTWVALARRAGHKVRIIESNDRLCTIEITRADDPDFPHRTTFTIEDAAQAGLCQILDGKVKARSAKGDKLPWEAYTATMLRNRAISNAGKFACPEVAIGFAIEGDYDYIPDDDIEVTAPEHHGDVMDAEVVPDPTENPEAVAAALDDIEAEYVGGEKVTGRRKGPIPPSIADALMRDVCVGPGCWTFTGPVASNGYGRVSWEGDRVYAHRVSYQLHVGPIPADLTIDHLCRNRVCVNPAHLEAVTRAVNSARATRSHCGRGHALADPNIYYSRGARQRRMCRACTLLRIARRRVDAHNV